MPQKLEQCQDIRGNTLRGFRWDPRSHIIYHSKMMNLKDMRFSTGIRNESKVLPESVFQKVIKVANAEILRRTNEERQSIEKIPLLRELIEKIISSYEKERVAGNKAKHTLNTVKSSFDKLNAWWGNRFPDEITASTWEEFQDWFDEKYPGYNAYNVTKYMRVLTRYCLEHGLLKLTPTISDRNKKKSEKKRNAKKDWVYTLDEILRIEAACQSDLEKLVVGFGHMMAFRVSDALNLTWDRIDFDKANIIFNLGDDKEDTEATCPLPDDLLEILKKYPKFSKWVFPQKLNPDQSLKPQQFDYKAILTRAGVSRGTHHSLRHYRLSEDFKNPKFTAAQVCAIRRISFAVALKHYIHMDVKDLDLLRNAGSLKTLKSELGT